MKTPKKFKAVEKDAEIKSKFTSDRVGDIQWEGEELSAESQTKIESDTGTGQAIVLRFFEFGVNPLAFKDHKPTEQELFESHRRGIESSLWVDGLRPYEEVQPRIMFSKSKTHYRIIVATTPKDVLLEQTQTLSQLLR